MMLRTCRRAFLWFLLLEVCLWDTERMVVTFIQNQVTLLTGDGLTVHKVKWKEAWRKIWVKKGLWQDTGFAVAVDICCVALKGASPGPIQNLSYTHASCRAQSKKRSTAKKMSCCQEASFSANVDTPLAPTSMHRHHSFHAFSHALDEGPRTDYVTSLTSF